MRKLVSLVVSMLLLASLALAGCAATNGAGTSSAGPGAGQEISVTDALTQARGAATALATLAQTSPMDDATKAQMANYSAWANFALQAAGIIAPVVEAAVGAGS
jgi:predicted small secreted protein